MSAQSSSSTSATSYTPLSSSIAHRSRLAPLFSSLRRVSPRVPFWQLAAHRIPTLWSLYRGLLKVADNDEVRRHIGVKFRQNRHLTSPAQTKEQLIKAERLRDLFILARNGDGRSRALLDRYGRLIAARRENESWERAADNAVREMEYLRNRPIVTGYQRPTFFNRALPRLKPQPAHISMMIFKRRKQREQRLELFSELKEHLDDVRREATFEKMLFRTAQTKQTGSLIKPTRGSTLENSLHPSWDKCLEEWVGSINVHQQRLRTCFDADGIRLQSEFSPLLIETIEAARRNKARNKAKEHRREASGLILRKTLERASKGPPAHVLTKMTEEEKRLDRIARSSVSKVGYVGYAKMKLGWKMKRDPFKAEDGPNRSQRRLTETEKKIMEENKRRRGLWEKRNGEDGDADQPSEVLSV